MVAERVVSISGEWFVALFGTTKVMAQKIVEESVSVVSNASGYLLTGRGSFSSVLNWNEATALYEAVRDANPIEPGPRRMQDSTLWGLREAFEKRTLFQKAHPSGSEQMYSVGSLPADSHKMVNSAFEFDLIFASLIVDTLEEAREIVSAAIQARLATGAIIINPGETYFESMDWCSAKYLNEILDSSWVGTETLRVLEGYRRRLLSWNPSPEYKSEPC